MSAVAEKWLVTGAAGYLGSHVTAQLLNRGQRVIAVDDLSSGKSHNVERYHGQEGFDFERANICDPSRLNKIFATHRPTYVIHLAALHFIPAAVADPPRAVYLNVYGTQCILSAARAVQARVVWLASTGDVYKPGLKPHREDSTTSPFNIYGTTKLMVEQLAILESSIQPETSFFVGRLFNLYGPGETNPHILPEILDQLRKDRSRPLRLGNLWPRRDLVPVGDAARAVIESALRAPRGIMIANVATGVAHSMQDVLDIINAELGGSLKIETDPQKVRPVERDHLQADVTRLRELIGWTPHADLCRGIRELLHHEGLLDVGGIAAASRDQSE